MNEAQERATAVRVVRGTPDDVELAALVAGIAAARTAGDDGGAAGSGGTAAWSDRGRRLSPRAPGPDSWRWSLHP